MQKCKRWTARALMLLTVTLGICGAWAVWPTQALANPDDTFTITYMTNAGVTMGEVTYTVGAENAFPQINELSTLFPDFFARATQKGSVGVGAEGSRWYQDAALTQPATMPQGEAGANYVIYCRFSVGLNISQINNNAENTSYAQIRSVLNAPSLSVNYATSIYRHDIYSNVIATFEKNVDGQWVEVDESYRTFTDEYGRTSTWPNMIYFRDVADSGTYRLKHLRYTAVDNAGNALFYDDATDTTALNVSILPVTLTINGVTATDRAYDGHTEVALTGGALQGVLFGDDVSFALGQGTLADANAGPDKAVTTSITLTGTKANNYTLTQPTVTVNITPAQRPVLTDEGFTVTDESEQGKADGIIAGLQPGMAYKGPQDAQWIVVDEPTDLTNLAPGDYQVRIEADTNYQTSNIVTLTVLPGADYSTLDALLNQIPADLSGYTDESVQALNDAVAAIQRGQSASNQAVVDGYVQALQQALDGLQEKPTNLPQTGETGAGAWLLLLAMGAGCVCLAWTIRRRHA